MSKRTIFLWHEDNAEEPPHFYVAIFPYLGLNGSSPLGIAKLSAF